MIKKTLFLFLCAILLSSCKAELQDADIITNKSIEMAGGAFIKNATIAFDFRDKYYKAMREGGQFQLERSFKDSLHTIRDVLDNNKFQRFINGTPFKVSKAKEAAYTSSVNSVHYFSVLPYGLHDKAVNKRYLGTTKIKGQDYYKIKITFNEAGGGEDFEDVFVYWIHAKTFKVGYLAYSYAESHGMGLRFREGYNERLIKGIRFLDYNNYKPKQDDARLETLDMAFENGTLELVSKIELKNIQVTL